MSKGLGRGLDALIPLSDDSNNNSFQTGQDDVRVEEKKEPKYLLDINLITPNPHQPRKRFKEEELQDLANSIKEHGVIQPLIITKEGENFVLIAGERRLRASKLAGLSSVPVIYRETTELQKVEVSLIENIQRSDLNPLEEAVAYRKLIDDFSLTQEQVAKKVGKARSTVANTVRLLTLPIEIKQGLRDGLITEGHARSILALDTLEEQLSLYNQIITGGLNVRQAEAKTKAGVIRNSGEVDIHLNEVIENLSHALNAKVSITKKGTGGKIGIEYYSEEELERIIGKVMGHRS